MKCLYVAAKYVVVAGAVLLYFGLAAKKMFRCWSAAVHVVWLYPSLVQGWITKCKAASGDGCKGCRNGAGMQTSTTNW